MREQVLNKRGLYRDQREAMRKQSNRADEHTAREQRITSGYASEPTQEITIAYQGG
jgi:hypothetical protein